MQLLILHLYLGQKQSFSGLFNIWKDHFAPKYQVTSSRCEDLILSHFYLQILNDTNVKSSRESLR